MYEQDLKTNTQRIINISNIYNIKQNSFNDNYTFIKSMNNSISSQKLMTQNSTCSSYLKSNKTFSNEENLITDIKPIRREANKSLLKNLCVTNFIINSDTNASNIKKFIYKKKQVNNPNNINTIRNKREKNKKINLINEEFTKKLNNKEKKEFTDLTLDEYLKEEIKYINKKNYNENNNNDNKENENTQSINMINNQDKNHINKNKNKKNSKKSLLNKYITYNKYKSIDNKKLKQNKIKPKLSSKIAYINLPKPKRNLNNKINSKINSNIKNKNNTFNHRKYNSFDDGMKNIIKKERRSQNLKDGKNDKIKIINLQIDLNDLISENNKKDIPKKTFRFSRSSKKLNDNININDFKKDFFILPKLKKF